MRSSSSSARLCRAAGWRARSCLWGLPGIGKRTFALKLAQGLLCERVPEERLDPCGECPSCHQVRGADRIPTWRLIGKPADKAFIPLELLIGDAEHRMRAGLCYNIALKPYSGRRKVAIIDDADYLNKEGANCLLKTLEEPPPQVGADPDRHERAAAASDDPLALPDRPVSAAGGGGCGGLLARAGALR